jgi:hypothetical protein
MVLILHCRGKGLLLVPNGRHGSRRTESSTCTGSRSSLAQIFRPLSPPTEEPESDERADDEGDTNP